MAKFMQILFVAFLAIALVSAEPKRFQGKRRFLARQEVAEEAVTPYPSADELKPEVPFNEAEAAEEQTPNQPDEVYGPPEQDVPVETDDVVPTEDEEAVAVAEEEEAVAAEEAAAEEAAAEEAAVEEEEAVESARLTARRAGARKSAARPAKLRKAAPARLQLQRQFVPQPIFYYITQ
ncbi:small ribosomal subunit protein bS16-like [Musca vetustissima]|uniref:small ribosomal subunit protein bS16-like n=1 Tax=Musca vetustissima TaxID=27455 RepID=UPI002AB7096B|nr:small ribosomal subunit protein bS16-like [Musca vetustissima]